MSKTTLRSRAVGDLAPAGVFAAIVVATVLEAMLLAGRSAPASQSPHFVRATDTPPAAAELPSAAADAAIVELPDESLIVVPAVEDQHDSDAIVAPGATDSSPQSHNSEPKSDQVPAPAPPQLAHRPPAPSWTPAELQATLLRIPEIGLQPPGVLSVPHTGAVRHGVHPLLSVIDARPDLHGLPVRRGTAAQLPRPEADAFRDASVLFRKGLGEILGAAAPRNRRLAIEPAVLKARPDVVARVVHQMLQISSVPLRTYLIGELKQFRDPAATRALAHQAIYEPVPKLRAASVRALESRPPNEYLPVLLDAFRNPWPPAADYAAEALVALSAHEAVPELIRRLNDPSPTAPMADKYRVNVVRELVRVNHSRNCLLCHAESVSRQDGIRVAVPTPLRPLPSPFSLNGYEGGGRGGAADTGSGVFARPDITYLQQDFSWVLPVANPGRWPALQRYDFLVRTRPATANDTSPSDFPQRRALLRALQALTGRDFDSGRDTGVAINAQ